MGDLKQFPNLRACRWCAKEHGGDYCPTIEAIDYWEDGTIARVEFRDLAIEEDECE